jgi:hypothetical protein
MQARNRSRRHHHTLLAEKLSKKWPVTGYTYYYYKRNVTLWWLTRFLEKVLKKKTL